MYPPINPPINPDGEQRENVRAKDRLQVTYRIIESEDISPTENAERYFPLIWTKYPTSIILEETEDTGPKILPHIIDLNRKIDLLVELLIHRDSPPSLEIVQYKDVCISASGIKLNIGEPSNPGQKIALCIILPFAPPAKLFVLGEITRSILLAPVLNEEGTLYETGIRFLNIHEEDCEKIIRYIFKRQRDLLKEIRRLTNEEHSDYNSGQ